MNKCLKIIFSANPTEKFLREVLQETAKQNSLEGLCQPLDDTNKSVKIIVCGNKDKIDTFVDALHKEAYKKNITDIKIEPFIKDKDYRGVFRVVE